MQNCQLFRPEFDTAIHQAGSLRYMESVYDPKNTPSTLVSLIHKACSGCVPACQDQCQKIDARLDALKTDPSHVYQIEGDCSMSNFLNTIKQEARRNLSSSGHVAQEVMQSHPWGNQYSGAMA